MSGIKNRKKINKYLLKKLQEIQFDLTNHCNVNCPMCYMSYHRFKEQGFFQFDLFKKIIDEIVDEKYFATMIKLYWIGEPLLHPEFNMFVDYIFKKKLLHDFFKHTMVSTNGFALDRTLAQNILNTVKTGVDNGLPEDTFLVVLFSVDAITPETYRLVKPGAELNNIMENIKTFLSIRESLGLNYPVITLQFVIQEHNHSEVGAFVDYWKRFFRKIGKPLEVHYSWWHNNEHDHIAIMPCTAHSDFSKQNQLYKLYLDAIAPYTEAENHDPFGDYSNRFRDCWDLDLDKQEKDGCEYDSDDNRQPCSSVFKAPNIKHNGEIALCCRQALSEENNVGNLNKNTLTEIWTGEKMHNVRLEQINGIFNYGCDECITQEQWGFMTDSEIIEFLRLNGEENLINKFVDRKQF
ncbi:radical SAM protein [bacterium]|nr:radical SAM protein [bacterium]